MTANGRMEREKALRDERKAEVQPLITFADRRFLLILNREGEALAEPEESHEPLPVPEEDPQWLPMSLVVPDESVRTASDRFREAYNKASGWPYDPSASPEDVRAVKEALRDLRDRARDYTYGT